MAATRREASAGGHAGLQWRGREQGDTRGVPMQQGVLECAVQSACRHDGDRAGVRGEGGACSPSPAAFEHLALKFCALSTESKMAEC